MKWFAKWFAKAPAPIVDKSHLLALHIQPGDTLILTTDNHLTIFQRSAIASYCKSVLGQDCKVMVLEGGLRIGGIAVAPPDEITSRITAQPYSMTASQGEAQ